MACHYANVSGIRIFYREAGQRSDRPTLLLLHGYPASSFQYRELIPRLASTHHVVAPDLPGFGWTTTPSEFEYTFENLAKAIEAFVDLLELKRLVIYVFDYGAPTGWRLATARSELIAGIISQNGNAFEQGFGNPFWQPLFAWWEQESTSEARGKIDTAVLNLKATKWQYETGESGIVPPESYTLDQALIDRPGGHEIQLDLFYDYRNNVKFYPTLHDYFRKHQPPLLAIWGKNDQIFVPAGAEAFKELLPNAQVQFVDGGHFALELHVAEISVAIQEWLATTGL